MGAAASSAKYKEIHGASQEELKSVFSELTDKEKERVEMALGAVEKPKAAEPDAAAGAPTSAVEKARLCARAIF